MLVLWIDFCSVFIICYVTIFQTNDSSIINIMNSFYLRVVFVAVHVSTKYTAAGRHYPMRDDLFGV